MERSENSIGAKSGEVATVSVPFVFLFPFTIAARYLSYAADSEVFFPQAAKAVMQRAMRIMIEISFFMW